MTFAPQTPYERKLAFVRTFPSRWWACDQPELGMFCRYHQSTRPGIGCPRYAGEGTSHYGWGRCTRHASKQEHEVWSMALELSNEIKVTPWAAMAIGVQRAYDRAMWTDRQLQRAAERYDIEADGPEPVTSESSQSVHDWLSESRSDHTQLARLSKGAIDAGIAERVTRQVELEGKIVSDAVVAALDRLSLSSDDRRRALEGAHSNLLEARQDDDDDGGPTSWRTPGWHPDDVPPDDDAPDNVDP